MILLLYLVWLGPRGWPVSIDLAYWLLIELAAECAGLWGFIVYSAVHWYRSTR